MERFAGWFLTKPSKDAVMHVYWSRAAFASRKCWGARDTICGHKAKDITPSIAWRGEAWREEALDDLPWKDERGPSSIRQTLELFQRQRWGNFWETGWSAYGLFRAYVYHLELNLNEPNWTRETSLAVQWSKFHCLNAGIRLKSPHMPPVNTVPHQWRLHWKPVRKEAGLPNPLLYLKVAGYN